MTLVCVSLMLGIMGVYKLVGAQYKNGITSGGIEPSVFKMKILNTKP